MKEPVNVKEVRSFLGMANYCSRFIKDFSSITKPLRDLTHKNTVWRWGSSQKKAFQKIKKSLVKGTTMGYFDPEKKTS